MRLIMGLLLVSSCLVAEAVEPATDAEIRESKVYEAIGEMTVRRDELLKKFAVVMSGETVNAQQKRGLRTWPTVSVRIVDGSRNFDLRGYFHVLKDYGQPFESGVVSIRDGTQYKAIEQNPFLSPLLVKPNNTSLSTWHAKHPVMGGTDPYDDYLTGASTLFSHNHNAIEYAVLGRYDLVKTEEGIGGRLISHWTQQIGKRIDWKIAMEFDPAVDLMPVRVKINNQAIENDFQDTRITWKKHGKKLLPHRIEYAHGSMSNTEEFTEGNFLCYWLVGDEVPDSIFESGNQLAALLDHFDMDHTRRIGGDVVATQHQPPQDLFEVKK